MMLQRFSIAELLITDLTPYRLDASVLSDMSPQRIRSHEALITIGTVILVYAIMPVLVFLQIPLAGTRLTTD